MSTRIIGIDLAVTAAHQAAILDPATSQFVVKRMALRRLPDDLDRLLVRARRGAGDNPELIVVLEATAMAWHAVSVPFGTPRGHSLSSQWAHDQKNAQGGQSPRPQ